MKMDINLVLYAYLIACLVLLIYNFGYIAGSERKLKRQRRQAEIWKTEIRKQIQRLENSDTIQTVFQKNMRKKLKNSRLLAAYLSALNELKDEGICTDVFVKKNSMVMQNLADEYRRKDSVDKAFFAHVIAGYPPDHDHEYGPILEILLTYLDDSTVYCRENVLRAFYAWGNAAAVEMILSVFNDRGWYHNNKLISDGMTSFTGNHEELAGLLWGHISDWNENLAVSIVQYITAVSDKYKERFLTILSDETTYLEVRLAIMRYYRRYRNDDVKPVLFRYLRDNQNLNLSIVAVSVLGCYPGEDTLVVLKEALRHFNWYVRYNAATSLVMLGIRPSDLRDILEGNDAYAKEILEYTFEKEGIPV